MCDPGNPNELRSWQRVIITQESAERDLVQQRVEKFEARESSVIETKLRMTQQQSEQVTRIMDEIKSSERDVRFEWCWVEISLHNQNGAIRDFDSRVPGIVNSPATATTIYLIAKRSLKPQYNALEVYNALMNLAPSPSWVGRPGPGPSPGPPVIIPPRPAPPPRPIPMIKLRSKSKMSKRHVEDSDSDSTTWSSDSSIGNVRRRLRYYKAKKVTKAARKRYYDSDSGSDGEEQEDVIKIDIKLKRGDDVVKKLLDIWTVEPGVEGKGKGRIV